MKYPEALTIDEWNVLSSLARVSKMDCWFVLRSNGRYDWCYDAEEQVALSLHKAIGLMEGGLTQDDVDALDVEQRAVYNCCLKRFAIVA